MENDQSRIDTLANYILGILEKTGTGLTVYEIRYMIDKDLPGDEYSDEELIQALTRLVESEQVTLRFSSKNISTVYVRHSARQG